MKTRPEDITILDKDNLRNHEESLDIAPKYNPEPSQNGSFLEARDHLAPVTRSHSQSTSKCDRRSASNETLLELYGIPETHQNLQKSVKNAKDRPTRKT